MKLSFLHNENTLKNSLSLLTNPQIVDRIEHKNYNL